MERHLSSMVLVRFFFFLFSLYALLSSLETLFFTRFFVRYYSWWAYKFWFFITLAIGESTAKKKACMYELKGWTGCGISEKYRKLDSGEFLLNFFWIRIRHEFYYIPFRGWFIGLVMIVCKKKKQVIMGAIHFIQRGEGGRSESNGDVKTLRLWTSVLAYHIFISPDRENRWCFYKTTQIHRVDRCYSEPDSYKTGRVIVLKCNGGLKRGTVARL